ncbi:MAG: hypothetical protein RIQ41_273 [Candidatus Parcubacteria bacterium]|jgi:hypothetical protein
METPSYIAENVDELFESSPPDIKALLQSKEVDEATALLGKIYKLPINRFVRLENIISFILIGALKPEDVVRASMELLDLTEEEALRLAGDMEKSILEKARIKILGKGTEDMVTLSFKEGRSSQDLRGEILDTTKRDSVFAKGDEQERAASKVVAEPGSRSQLLEQLRILDDIPNDDEIADRLQKIKQQITGITQQEDAREAAAVPEPLPRPEDVHVAEPDQKTATYSKAPTKYNVDPYREVAQ